MKAWDRRACFSPLSFRLSRARIPLTKSEEKERLLAVYNHPESGKFLSLESGILGFGIPNLPRKEKSWILLSLTEKMLLIKRKTNPDFVYLKELRLAQGSLQMIWRCLGYWGTLSKMWKNSAERSYSFGILGQLRFNTDKCKVMSISEKTNTVGAS